MAYSRTTWQNSPSTATPISAELLNNMEQGIVDIESDFNALAGTVGVAMGTAGTAVNTTATQGSVTATQGSVAATQGSVANTQGSVSSHVSATTSVHGITDTANLVYTNNATLGSVAGINASLGSALGTISTNTAAIGSVSGTVTTLVNQQFYKLVDRVSRTSPPVALGTTLASTGNLFPYNIIFTADGTTTYKIIITAPRINGSSASGGHTDIHLTDGLNNSLGIVASIFNDGTAARTYAPLYSVVYLTPAAGTVTYNVSGISTGGSGGFASGPGGGYTFVPANLEVYK